MISRRYQGEVGDVVVGRITEVAQKRWKVDVNSKQEGILQLASIHLPGGVQVYYPPYLFCFSTRHLLSFVLFSPHFFSLFFSPNEFFRDVVHKWMNYICVSGFLKAI